MTISDLKAKMSLKKVSAYRIAKELDEPVSSIYNFLKGEKVYSNSKAVEILERINNFLNGDIVDIDDEDIFDNLDTYTKLYEVGLNSKTFTPDEKLHLATMHKKLMNYKKQRNENPK